VLDAYFCPRVAARLRTGPEPGVLESFLVYLHRRGHPRAVTQRYVREAEVFVRWLRRRRHPVATVTDVIARVFACRGRDHGSPRPDVHAALRHLLRHLRERGLVPPRPPEAAGDVGRVIAGFDAHLRDAAGLAPATRLYRRRYAREFLTAVFGTGQLGWGRLRPEDVHAFVARYGRTGRTAAARVAAVSLRSLLRWLQLRGHIGPTLAAAVPTFRRWRHTALPQPLTDDQYRGLLAAFDRTTPVGHRDYAMAVCLGDLGLRCGEVADLTLDDLDGAAGTLWVAAGKSRRGRVLPMPARVRQAITAYLGRGRPASTDPHLFLRHRTPAGVRVSRALVRGVVARAFARVHGCEGWTGTHVLRHTAATGLHRAGADVKRVADILGHRSIDTAAIYAKVDLGRLSAVALPWPAAGEVRP
jgi:integrase/recombinase XerD